jgi:hypothetical protein
MIWTRLYHEPNEECFHLKSLAEFYESVHLDRKLSTGHLLKGGSERGPAPALSRADGEKCLAPALVLGGGPRLLGQWMVRSPVHL